MPLTVSLFAPRLIVKLAPSVRLFTAKLPLRLTDVATPEVRLMLSAPAGTLSVLQFAASPQLSVAAPPSQVMTGGRFAILLPM